MSLLSNMVKYRCHYCGWENNNPSTHSQEYEECETRENESYKFIDIIEQLFLILNAKERIKIYRSSDCLKEAYISVSIDEELNDIVSGKIKYGFKDNDIIYNIIEVYNKYKNLENYILLIANKLIVNTESDDGHILEIIKKGSDYMLEVPVLEHKIEWATRYWD